MIARFLPTNLDAEALAASPKVANHIANTFDYSDVVVSKPWGYERLWYEDDKVAAWILSINRGETTSTHCHEHKRTCLVLVTGAVTCQALRSGCFLEPGEAVLIEANTFHATMARLDSLVLELETPPLKGDLVRYRDHYNRVGTGYEPASHDMTPSFGPGLCAQIDGAVTKARSLLFP